MVCTDERQFVPPDGQQWTTREALALTHRNAFQRLEPGLLGIGTEPAFAIGQRALVVETSAGNTLWDCVALLDEATTDIVRALGGLAAIAVSSIPLFNEDLERAYGGAPDTVHCLRHAVAAADGLLLATPEYEQSIPGVLKNALDWLSRSAPDRPLVGKPVAVVGATTGRWGTRMAQATLRQILFASGAHVLPGPSVFASHAEVLFDAAGLLVDSVMRGELVELLGSFTTWIEGQRHL